MVLQKKNYYTLVALLLFLFVVITIANISTSRPCSFDLDKKSLYFGETVFTVEIADTDESRKCGLSYRKDLEPLSGMLFIFKQSDYHGIWMQSMNFSLDIIWIDEELRVVDTARSVKPKSYPKVFIPIEAARYVLELAEGSVERYKIYRGVELILEK